MSRLVLIRTDASVAIGSGHVMRCLTLAQALRSQNREVEFVCRHLPGHLIDLVRQHGFVTHELPPFANPEYQSGLLVPIEQDADETRAILKQRPLEWLVVDHYGIDARWERKFETETQRLMVIDDTADRDHVCHLLLDQNFSSHPERRYVQRVPPHCSMLLGPNFSLLREEFTQRRLTIRERDGKIRKVLVSFGGSDPKNLTGLTLDTLSAGALSSLDVDVVLGASSPHRQSIEKQLQNRQNGHLHVRAMNMAELMSNADLSIGAGGITTWERMCLGLPAIVVTIADNQIYAIRDLHNRGLLRWAGHHDKINAQNLHKVITSVLSDSKENLRQGWLGMQLVDGYGANRVASVMCDAIPVNALRLRNACLQDCALYWTWVNDSEVRLNSTDSHLIPWSTHCEWFGLALANPDKWLFVIDGPFGPVGQVRFERINGVIDIDYSVSIQFRGRGLGKHILSLAIQTLSATASSDVQLRAIVKNTNRASARVFENLGFFERKTAIRGFRVFEMHMKKSFCE